MTATSTSRRTLLDRIETQRLGCELSGSPLYARALEVVAADVQHGGPCARILDPVANAPFGDAVLLRFLGALHRAVLAGHAPGLAAHFPSAGGTPGPHLGADLLAAVEDHGEEITVQLACGVQTNEVGRSAALIGGLLALAPLGLPLRLLEVGSSAGLNLNLDRYRYEAGDLALGPADSPLVFRDVWFPAPPDLGAPLDILERRGSDLSPIDATTDEGRLRLRSFVWPDQAERLARLDAAIAVAVAHPPVVDAEPALTWAARHLREPMLGRTTVVVPSIVLQYLAPTERDALLAELDAAGSRATSEAPLAWLRLEPGGDQAQLCLTTWPGAATRLLATSSYHGPPVVWRAGVSGEAAPMSATPEQVAPKR